MGVWLARHMYDMMAQVFQGELNENTSITLTNKGKILRCSIRVPTAKARPIHNLHLRGVRLLGVLKSDPFCL